MTTNPDQCLESWLMGVGGGSREAGEGEGAETGPRLGPQRTADHSID